MRGIDRNTGLCLLFVCVIAGAEEFSWDELIRRSEVSYGQGKLGEAESDLLRAVKAAEAFAPSDRRLAETQHRLGTLYNELGKLPEGEKWLQRSLSGWKMSAGGCPSR